MVSPLADPDVVEIGGVVLTSPARSVADCLRSLSGRDGLALADQALHRGLVTRAALVEVIQRQTGWPGAPRARKVLALADPLRESPLESWSAWAFAHTGLPAPQSQVQVCDADGLRLGRVDFWWELAAVAGEADGRAKYGLALAGRGGTAEALMDVLQAELRREQRLREVGVEVVRWSVSDVLSEPAARDLARRIKAAIVVGRDSGRFSGLALSTAAP